MVGSCPEGPVASLSDAGRAFGNLDALDLLVYGQSLGQVDGDGVEDDGGAVYGLDAGAMVVDEDDGVLAGLEEPFGVWVSSGSEGEFGRLGGLFEWLVSQF